MLYRLYNADQRVASFVYEKGVITDFIPEKRHLLPIQMHSCKAKCGYTKGSRLIFCYLYVLRKKNLFIHLSYLLKSV